MEFDLSRINFSKFDVKRGLILPKKSSKELAEFIGILAGDGYINHYSPYFYLLEIAGDTRLDYDYLVGYVRPLIKYLFNLNSKLVIRAKQNSMYLRIMSKGLVLYLEQLGFPKGKKGQIDIPSWIKGDNEYFCSFVKGLADTDFSLSLLKRNQKKFIYYPRVSLSLKSKVLVKNISEWLTLQNIQNNTQLDVDVKDQRGFTSKINRLHINGRKNLEKWMRLVSFRNNRHLSKYEKYKSGSAGI